MADLPSLLLASLSPGTRRQAEQNLQTLSLQPGFLPQLLRLVLDASQDRSVRLAGSVYLKNTVKSRWEDVCLRSTVVVSLSHKCTQEESAVAEADKVTLRRDLIPAMMTLSGLSDKAVRAQIAETISSIAVTDFPEKWPDLIDVSLVLKQMMSCQQALSCWVVCLFSDPHFLPVCQRC